MLEEGSCFPPTLVGNVTVEELLTASDGVASHKPVVWLASRVRPFGSDSDFAEETAKSLPTFQSVEETMKHKTLLIAIAFLFTTRSPIARAQAYSIADLGSLSPTGINTWGQVVGTHNGHAVMWTRTRGTRDLGILQGGTFSSAKAINDLGVVAGVTDGPGIITWPDGTTENCKDLVQPFLWRRATGMRGLGAPAPMPVDFYSEACGLYSYANDINSYGQVVGSNQDFATYKFGFLRIRSNGWTQFSDTYQTAATGINNVGQVAGQTSVERLADESHAALWDNGVMTE